VRIYTIWPADKFSKPGGDWRQWKRWLVLDVTDGINSALIVYGPVPRDEALREELRLRAAERVIADDDGDDAFDSRKALMPTVVEEAD